MNEPRTGVLLVNLGTPDSPAVGDVRRYLREFLGDPRVLDMPALARWLLLNFVILPVRPRTTARAYAQVWTPQGSPLRVHGEALRDGVAQALGPDYVVALGMRYGEPSIAGALEQLCEADVARVLALPLFPQYSEAATGSAAAKIHEELARGTHLPPIEMQGAFYADPGFIASFAEVARPQLEEFRPDFVLFSYHGLPEHQVRACDKSGSHCLERSDCCDAVGEVNRLCYRAHCFATTRALSAALGLDAERHSVASSRASAASPGSGPSRTTCCPTSRRAASAASPSSAPPWWPTVWRPSRRSASAAATSGWGSAARSCAWFRPSMPSRSGWKPSPSGSATAPRFRTSTPRSRSWYGH